MWTCPEGGAVMSHLLVFVLTAAWLVLTGLRVFEYLSEPTATKTLWERTNYLPTFTICPAIRTLSYDSTSENGTEGTARGNTTLVELFYELGLNPQDMLLDLNAPEENPSELYSCDSFGCIDFKMSIDYNTGGFCITSKRTTQEAFELVLQSNPDHEYELENSLTYDIVFHGHPDFFGDIYIEDPTYRLSTAQRGIEIIVTIDCQIQENLRRDPCTDDPSYSKRLCERQCFFDWLNCSMHDDAKTNKSRCMASDAEWYEQDEPLSVFEDAPDGLDACLCPKPCVTDLLSIAIKPNFYLANDSFTHVDVISAKIMKVLQTYVKYTFSDLMADTGGFLGLLLGSSLLSMCQLLLKPVKWACTKCRTRGHALSGRSRRGIEKNCVSVYPARRGEIVFRISPRLDRSTY